MALTHRVNVHSPASSLSESSFSMLTSTPSSDDPFEAIDESSSDEDEVVWTANEFDPDEDFILIPQSHVRRDVEPVHAEADGPPIHEVLMQLSLQERGPAAATPTPTTSTFPSRKSRPKTKASGVRDRRPPGVEVDRRFLIQTTPVTSPKTHRGRRRRGRKDASASYPSPSPSPERENDDANRFGARPLVEESDGECDPVFPKYEDAVCFITSFLSNPTAALASSAYTRLTFLQSLIIELGLVSPSSALPSTLKSAKRFLKARAFINIAEYLSVREQGLDKLQGIMFNSRKELTIDLKKRKGGRKANRGWVKQHGLNVLLVSVC